MEQEKEWYQDQLDKLTREIERGEIGGGTADYRIESLIAEATRRGIEQGKREAWEEALNLMEDEGHRDIIRAKLASL